jgi:quinol monooxygenase YgiN
MVQRSWRCDTPYDGDRVLVASRMTVRRLRDVPVVFRHSAAVLRQTRRSDGALRAEFRAHPLRRTFWTRSTWRDRACVDTYAQQQPHTTAMRALHDRIATACYCVTDLPPGTAHPSWRGVDQLLADVGRVGADTRP